MADRSKVVLVDSSVWVDFLRGTESPQKSELHRLIENEHPIVLTGLILMEVLQGVRENRLFEQVRDRLRRFPIIEPSGDDTYIQAASLYRNCRKQGVAVRSPIDCLISVIAIEIGASILHKDRDFEAISRICSLRLHPIPQ